MTIKTNNSSGVVTSGGAGADFTILQNNTSGRWAVTIINIHDIGGGDTLNLFVSNDATSAAGERIDQVVLAANETKPSLFTTVVLSPGQFLLGNAIGANLLNIEAIYIAYDGSS